MIILSGVLVVLAIALLVTGIVTGNTGHEILGLDGLKLIYVSIGVSIVSALFLAVGVFLRRKELFGTAPSSAVKPAGGRTTARPIKAKARVGAGDDGPTIPATSAMAIEVPAETTVYVVPGRKRYHLETCRQLAGRDKEELTFLEAREEGFTPCTACLPDTALAARAAFTDPGAATARPDDSAGTPVEVTRTDIPAARPPAEPRPSADTRDDIRDTSGRTRETPAESTASPTAETAVPSAMPGSAAADETAANRTAAEETAAVESPAGRPARRRSMFEPLDHTGAEPATGRTAFGDRDDETPAEPAAGDSHDDTEAARDEADATTDATTRPADTADTVPGAASAGAADALAEETAATETGHGDHDTAPLGGASGATAGSEQARTGGETETETGTRHEAGERDETAQPADEAGTATAAGRDADTDDAGDTVGAAGPDETVTEPAPDADDAADRADADAEDDRDAEGAEGAEDASAGDGTMDDATSAADGASTDEPAAEPADGTAGADDGESAEAETETTGPTVRVLSGTKRYHRPDCALIEGISDDADDLESLSRSEAKDRGCTPCLVCQPDDD